MQITDAFCLGLTIILGKWMHFILNSMYLVDFLQLNSVLMSGHRESYYSHTDRAEKGNILQMKLRWRCVTMETPDSFQLDLHCRSWAGHYHRHGDAGHHSNPASTALPMYVRGRGEDGPWTARQHGWTRARLYIFKAEIHRPTQEPHRTQQCPLTRTPILFLQTLTLSLSPCLMVT